MELGRFNFRESLIHLGMLVEIILGEGGKDGRMPGVLLLGGWVLSLRDRVFGFGA
jgi:hypothetical protein